MRSPTFFAICCLALAVGASSLVGCGKQATPSNQQSTSVMPKANGAQPVAPNAMVVDGSTTETSRMWSSKVKSQLAVIASSLCKNSESDQLTLAVADEVQATQFSKLLPNEVYEDGSIRVLKIHDQGKPLVRASIEDENEAARHTSTVKRESLIGSLRELLFDGSGDANKTARFKLFGIEQNGQQLITRQRLTTRGQSSARANRSVAYSVTEARWSLPAKQEGMPQLVGFSTPGFVKTELSAGKRKLLEDIAGRALSGNRSWSEQLQFGMNTWTRHIDRTLSPDFLGYHGVAIGDVDGDGLDDLYLCQPGGLPNLLFKQRPNGTLVDISRESGVDWLDNSTGALLIDLDNDGDKDLVLAARSALLLMANDGVGRFKVRGGLPNVAMGYSPTAADYDLDGDLDLLVLRYTSTDGKTGDFPTPHPFHDARNGGANVLLENRGGFQFADVTNERGLGSENSRFSFAASWEDYDNDGDLDLYIANDFGPNQLFRNDVRDGNHVLRDQSDHAGTRDWGFGMSATWADYDRDGRMDLYVSSMFSGAGNQIVAKADFNPLMPAETRRKYLKMVRGNSLLRNAGQDKFVDATNPMSEGYAGWAWGSKFADLNNDGWQDLYVGNGYISQPDKDDL